MKLVAVLVSPAPVDGYPPVQHQARLLADAGYAVELLSSPLPWLSPVIGFSYPGVTVYSVPAHSDEMIGAGRRLWDYVTMLTGLRRKLGPRIAVEIAYEPTGALYSDLALCRPLNRVIHFHETLQNFATQWLERRLRASIRGFRLAIVADADRGEILREQLSLDASHVQVVPNYPYLVADRQPSRSPEDPFTVVYCGALGLHQKLDVIIRSIKDWPEATRLRLIGQADTPTGRSLTSLARDEGVGDRVIFEGWVAYERVPERLAQADLGILLLDPSFVQFRTALGASNKRYQYMQAGLPQIGDMNPGVQEFLEGQSIGRCVTRHDVGEIAALVKAYAIQPNARQSEGRQARMLHETRYNYQAAFQPVLDWLAATASRRPAGSENRR